MTERPFSSAEFTQMRKRLREWYREHQRELPWRVTRDPYRIWLSEIMLQQTTVAAVIPYYERFLARFPDVQTLAAAEEGDVLRHWEGLGYYSRARNIHRTAQIVSQQFAGHFPDTPSQLQQLPGIGRYTAGAIVSFAFDKPAPIVEANTQRLYARLLAYDQPLTQSAGQKALWGFAEQIVPDKQPGLFNQALMDLGSKICTPANPQCTACPLSRYCRAYQLQKQAEIPLLKPKQPPTLQTHLCVAVRQQGAYLLQQYQPGQRWAGLWDFPRWESTSFPHSELTTPRTGRQGKALFSAEKLHSPAFQHVETEFRERYGHSITIDRHLTTIRHSVTRYSITLICFEATATDDSLPVPKDQPQWTSPADFANLAFSTTGRKVANLLSPQA